MLQAVLLKNSDQRLDEKARDDFISDEIFKRNQKRFMIYLSVASFIFIAKFSVALKPLSLIYNSSHILATINNAASDFIFVYHVLCLKDYIANLSKTLRDSKGNMSIKHEIYKIIEFQNQINDRFSLNLALTVSLNFLLVIRTFALLDFRSTYFQLYEGCSR